MARRIAAFLGEARESLDLALYDIRLPDEPGDIVAEALRDAHERGVRVRIAYNADHPERIFFPPPPKTKPELLEAMPFPTCGIPGIPDLMHHKYVVRDGQLGLDRLDELDDGLVDAPGERGAHRGRARPSSPPSSRRTSRSCGRRRNVEASGHEDPRPLEVDGRAGARVVHAGPRRGALAPDREGDRARARARADRVAGDHRGPGARHARRGGGRAAGGPARGGRSHADGAGGLPVADERPLGVEDPDPRVGARERGLQGQAVHAVRRPRRLTTSCTRRSRWPTTRSSPARSTCRAQAR